LRSHGFGVAERPGSRVHDELFHDPATGFTRSSNNAGGLEANDERGTARCASRHETPFDLKSPLRSVNMETKEAVIAHFERSDVCAVPAAGVICEAMVGIVLTETVLEKFAETVWTNC